MSRASRVVSAVTGHPRLRFDGWIAGVGTSSGTRVVLGHWPRSPFGPFSDAMVERADGERLLLAPTREIADFVSGTYTFDTVRVVPVDVSVAQDTWTVTATPSACASPPVGGASWASCCVLFPAPSPAVRPGARSRTGPPAWCWPVCAPEAVRAVAAGNGTAHRTRGPSGP